MRIRWIDGKSRQRREVRVDLGTLLRQPAGPMDRARSEPPRLAALALDRAPQMLCARGPEPASPPPDPRGPRSID